MKAIVINEDNHGFIGLAANYPWAIDFLVKENWLDENTEVWVDHRGYLLKEVFPNWYEEIKSWDVKKFNEFFECEFYLEPMEVYGVNYWG